MALIKCKECGKEVSNKAESCPNCGFPIAEKKKKDAVQKVEVIRNKKASKKIIIGLIIILLLGFGAFLLFKEINKAKVYAYENNLRNVTETLIDGVSKSVKVANLINKVWYNTIFKVSDEETDAYTKNNGKFYDDFNDALSNLFDSDDYKKDTNFIIDNKYELKDKVSKLKNPPKDFEQAYEDLYACYDSYLEMANLAVNPTGSYKSFSEKVDDIEIDLLKECEKLEPYYGF
jgi:ribosomal protein L37E